MKNLYLTTSEIKEAFRKVHLEENHNFLEEDLVKLANAFVMAAMPAIVRLERGDVHRLCQQPEHGSWQSPAREAREPLRNRFKHRGFGGF
jgi:hypothetical protein